MRRSLSSLFRNERGATAVEYGLILSLVVLAMVGALQTFASTAIDMWGDVSNQVTEASEGQ